MAHELTVPRPEDERPARITVAVVGAEGAVRDRIVAVLEASGLPVVRLVRTPGELGCGDADGPSTVVMSTWPRPTASRSALRAVHAAAPSAELVLVTPGMRGQTVRSALAAGADAIVFEQEVPDALVLAVRAVHAGQFLLSRSVRDEVEPAVLTFREKQVLGMVVMGLTNGEIASKLYLAESTVKSHLSSVFMKLGVCSRHEAAARILDSREGFVLDELGISREHLSEAVA